MIKIKSTYIIPSLLLVLMASCQNDNNSNNKNGNNSTVLDSADNKDEYTLSKSDLYEDYLAALDSTDIHSISKATTKFKSIFDEKDSTQNDKGILSFLTFQQKVERYGNEKIIDETANYANLVDVEFNGKKVSPAMVEFYKEINTNGFRIDQAEGMYFIKSNPAYIEQSFYAYASPTMEIYLRQLAKENQEGLAKDAAISIPFETLVQRVIWWEDFSTSIHTEPLKTTAHKNYQNYLTYLTVGLNNTPAINHENKAEKYFTDAYAYLKEVYPQSQSYEKLKPYIELIAQGKTTEAKELGLQLIK